MADTERTLVRLMTWLSPAFPVGAFSYSHGLERAVHDGTLRDTAALAAWLDDLMRGGTAWNDAVLMAEAWRRADERAALADLAALGQALAGSRERHRETMAQGAAFLKAAAPWSGGRPAADLPYPVAVGAVARLCGVPREAAIAAYLHAFLANLVQAAVRLVPLGQSEGVGVLAALEEGILAIAARAAASSPDDLGSAAIVSEIMAMRHETQHSRIFVT